MAKKMKSAKKSMNKPAAMPKKTNGTMAGGKPASKSKGCK